ncbi:MAG: S41 family peptidase [Muribaculaceae bacterium]|nr:S41 family peptidase [Muribaculaceae bacterium]
MSYSKHYISLVAMLICAAWTAHAQNENSSENNYASIIRNIELFNSIVKELNMYYVDTIDNDKTTEVAIKAMLDEIDPYTEYIPAREQDDFMVIATGEYGGIGSLISKNKKSETIISQPYFGSPAQKAGLRPGDIIIKIDSLNVTPEWNIEKVSSMLKGQMNTAVKVSVRRPWTSDSILSFDITREKIKVNSVPYYGVVKDDIGYIQLTTFNDKSVQEVKDALINLKKQNVKSIVLDLRGNGGGLLDAAVGIVGHFVPKGTEVLKTRGRLKQSEKTYKTTQEPVDTKIPLAVLIDGSSASSSEITAGALQDLDRAVIVGSRSFGKGLVQASRPVAGDGLLKVTISKYYIPSGRLIQAIDYSHRNAMGEAIRVPDSLTTVFHTAHGREVRDGGGITPDVNVEYPEINRLVYNVIRDSWAFDFATKYASSHSSIPPVDEFVITDDIYEDFVNFINPDEFNYDKVCETILEQLKKAAKLEGYLNETTEVELEKLESLLKHDLRQDLELNKSAISEILAGEIVKRYYYESGEVIEFLKHDPGIDTAATVMHSPEKVRQILAPPQQ